MACSGTYNKAMYLHYSAPGFVDYREILHKMVKYSSVHARLSLCAGFRVHLLVNQQRTMIIKSSGLIEDPPSPYYNCLSKYQNGLQEQLKQDPGVDVPDTSVKYFQYNPRPVPNPAYNDHIPTNLGQPSPKSPHQTSLPRSLTISKVNRLNVGAW